MASWSFQTARLHQPFLFRSQKIQQPKLETKNIKNIYWLVVWTPLKNISQLGWLFPIYGKIKNVPNHQPDLASDWTLQSFHVQLPRLVVAPAPNRRWSPPWPGRCFPGACCAASLRPRPATQVAREGPGNSPGACGKRGDGFKGLRGIIIIIIIIIIMFFGAKDG